MLKRFASGLAKADEHSLSTLAEMPSGPVAFDVLSCLSFFSTTRTLNFMLFRDLLERFGSAGGTLPLTIRVDFSTKIFLRTSVFSIALSDEIPYLI